MQQKTQTKGAPYPATEHSAGESRTEFRLIKWAERQEKLQPKETCFFWTSPTAPNWVLNCAFWEQYASTLEGKILCGISILTPFPKMNSSS